MLGGWDLICLSNDNGVVRVWYGWLVSWGRGGREEGRVGWLVGCFRFISHVLGQSLYV